MHYQFLTLAEQRNYAEGRARQIEAEHYQNAVAREETLTLPDDHPTKAGQIAQFDANLAALDATHAAVLAERDRVDAAPSAPVNDEKPAPAVPIEPTPYQPPTESDGDRAGDPADTTA